MGDSKAERIARGLEAPKGAKSGKRRVHNRGVTTPADWAGVDGSLVVKAIAAVAANGGALRFGYTRDGGAYSVGFYGDGDPWTEYISPNDDVDGFLKGVIEDYD